MDSSTHASRLSAGGATEILAYSIASWPRSGRGYGVVCLVDDYRWAMFRRYPIKPSMELVPNAALYSTQLADPHRRHRILRRRLQLAVGTGTTGLGNCWPFNHPPGLISFSSNSNSGRSHFAAPTTFSICDPKVPEIWRAGFDAQAVYCHRELPSLRPLASAT